MSSPPMPINYNISPFKFDDNNIQLSSSPRKNAIGKPSLRLSIPKTHSTLEQPTTEMKNPINNNSSNDNNNKISQGNLANDEKNCTMNNVSNENHQIQNNDKLSNGISSTSNESISRMTTPQIVDENEANVIDDSAIQIDNNQIELNNNNNNSQLHGLPSYAKFESDFRKRIDELSAKNCLDMQMNGKTNQFNSIDLIFYLCNMCVIVMYKY